MFGCRLINVQQRYISRVHGLTNFTKTNDVDPPGCYEFGIGLNLEVKAKEF